MKRGALKNIDINRAKFQNVFLGVAPYIEISDSTFTLRT